MVADLALGLDRGDLPEFGFMPRVPLLSEATERTEVDMKLGTMLLEAKLTEGDFQIQRAELVEQYRDLREVFESRQLPRTKRKYMSYQLIRNVLAAHALDLDFCTLLDARRPDLLEDWYNIVRCIRSATLRARCKVLTWQELSVCLPAALQAFLSVKYGIVPRGQDRKFRPCNHRFGWPPLWFYDPAVVSGVMQVSAVRRKAREPPPPK